MNIENSSPNLASLYPFYLRLEDPTEYSFAINYIGSWEAWEALCNEEQNKPIIERWRRELDVKLRSESLARIIEASKGETRDALSANKFLLEAPWNKEDKRGRPSKEQISYEAKKIAEEEQLIKESFNRIFNSEGT